LDNKTNTTFLSFVLYPLFKYSKSSAMMTVIAKVGIKVGRSWRWHWRRRWLNVVHLEEDVKVGCE
jgi:hypothetical protein